MESEHRRALLLLLVQLVRVDLPLADGEGLRLVPRGVLRHRLHVEEDGLLGDAVVVLGTDDELAAVRDLDAVDDEGVVVADVALHVLDALPQLDVVVVPADGARRQADDAASEASAVTLDGKRLLRLDDEPAAT